MLAAIHRIQVIIWFSCAVLLRRHYGFAPPNRSRRRIPIRTQKWNAGTTATPTWWRLGEGHDLLFSTCSSIPVTRTARTFFVSNTCTTQLSACTTTITATISIPLLCAQVQQWSAFVVTSVLVCFQAFRRQTQQRLRQGTIWYLSLLDTFPLITKSITSGLIGVIADYAAQWFEQCRRRRFLRKCRQKENDDDDNDKDDSWNNGTFKLFVFDGSYDKRRGFATFVDGIFISGPIMHWGYNLMEHIVPVASSAQAATARAAGGTAATATAHASSLAAMIHVIADMIVLDSIFVATAIVGTGLLEGYRFRKDIVPQLQRDYASTLRASWVTSATLLPVEFVCFRFLPVTLRTLAMNLTDVIWDGVVSFMAHRNRLRQRRNDGPSSNRRPEREVHSQQENV